MKLALAGIALVGLGIFGVTQGGFRYGTQARDRPGSKEEIERRDLALTRARVLRNEPFDARAIDFNADPNRGVVDPRLVTCRFQPDDITGTTAKFDCELSNGEKVKVKYGGTREIPSELAATRLLHALGFGADRVSRVDVVRCFGCPLAPFHTRMLAGTLGLGQWYDERRNYQRPIEFKNVSVERNLDGEAIEVGDQKGWAFHELSRIDPSRGGASRAEVDALRLMAMFLNHWDNKAQNQRLVCPGSKTADCAHPLAMIQDAGSEFGPGKVKLRQWQQIPIWSDEASCTLSMKNLPYKGATFQDVRVSEEGRRLLADRLTQLSQKQIFTLFTAGGFTDVPQWVAAFQEKVRQLSERAACPSGRASS